MASAPSQPSANPDLSWARVLVVDDNQQNLELLQAYLEDIPELTLVSAADGLEAMQRVAQERPHLVLLDIMMPKMSGFEVCKQIKSNPETRQIQVIMVTALSETGDIERATECGTDDFLTKPIDRKGLVELVRTMLAAHPR